MRRLLILSILLSAFFFGCIGGAEDDNDVDNFIPPSASQPIEAQAVSASNNTTTNSSTDQNSSTDGFDLESPSKPSDSQDSTPLDASDATYNAISKRDVAFCQRIDDSDERYKCIKKWCETKAVADFVLCSTLEDVDDKLHCMDICKRPGS